MSPLKGAISVPGDKSISHRALIFSVLTRGKARVENLSPAEDVQSTRKCLGELGLASRELGKGLLEVDSEGLESLRAPARVLDAGNSGTTIRLLAGLVAGRPFESKFDGDASLRRRTMKRILEPLSSMGAKYEATSGDLPPFKIHGGNLVGRHFDLNVASAQVEACLLLSGLQADGMTSVKVPHPVRDHTSRMFEHLAIPFERTDQLTLLVRRLVNPPTARDMSVPGDLSSAAFFLVAAACMEGSDLTLTGVGLNPGRTLILDVLERMGASIEIENRREQCGEPVGDIRIQSRGGGRELTGCVIGGDEVALGIDELPVLALAGTVCSGEMVVSGAEDLRHKESDRISSIVGNLKAAGADVDETPDGFIVRGQRSISGGSTWKTFGDHRLAMTGMVASLVFDEPVEIDDDQCIAVSYPGFKTDLHQLL